MSYSSSPELEAREASSFSLYRWGRRTAVTAAGVLAGIVAYKYLGDDAALHAAAATNADPSLWGDLYEQGFATTRAASEASSTHTVEASEATWAYTEIVGAAALVAVGVHLVMDGAMAWARRGSPNQQ